MLICLALRSRQKRSMVPSSLLTSYFLRIRFTTDFYMFDSTVYYVEARDGGGFDLIADGNDFAPISFYKSRQDTVSRVEYTTQDIAGTWRAGRGAEYVFGTDGNLQITGYSPTTWERGEIPYTIENGWGQKWAVRMYDGQMIIMAGYMNILYKQ
ncbi:MAG: hypothetical protein R6V48_01925 [Fidelibacterota bacterium]